jgi:hypothetical protein
MVAEDVRRLELVIARATNERIVFARPITAVAVPRRIGLIRAGQVDH